MEPSLQFKVFSSAVENQFWFNFSRKKLDQYKLNDEPIKLTGYYENGYASELPSCLNVVSASFDNNFQGHKKSIPISGYLINYNLSQEFKEVDKNELIYKYGIEIWDDIKKGHVLENPSLLNRFLLISYADLKRFQFYYWFAFPALSFQGFETKLIESKTLKEKFDVDMVAKLHNEYDKLSNSDSSFFIVENKEKDIKCHFLKDIHKFIDQDKNLSDEIIIGFSDPSSSESYPGWPLRNLIAFLESLFLQNEFVNILCFRDRYAKGIRSSNHSLVLKIGLPKIKDLDSNIKFVGWERNERQKFGPRSVNLSKTMDPIKISESSVDLNLKLMRWRVLPALDLDYIKTSKYLLLGSGTLGCNVARCLLGWGAKDITLVDNAQVSYSNPVRQSLFEFEDSLEGGKPKAETAAKALARIHPGVNATALKFSIPMPGHPISKALLEQVRKDVETLETLIEDHDAVFLLMDTRESRWLPTLIASSKHKIVINAALGFDTYLVMRHGVKLSDAPENSDPNLIHGSQLGCYFCNDVVAPADSTKDRTLDQACTVSRPGLSMIASALSVELLMSILQHPLKGHVFADTSQNVDMMSEDNFSILGVIPHQIRGFLSRFNQVMPATSAFDKCTACSDVIREKYEEEGFDFLLRVFNESSFLEDVSGLSQLHEETLTADLWELSD